MSSNDVVEALNAMGWTQEQVNNKIRVLNRKKKNDYDKKVHVADCQTNIKLPLTEDLTEDPTGIQFYTLKNVEDGNLNGRKICGHKPCKDAYDAIQRSKEQQRTLALEKQIEELKAAREADKRKEKKRLKMEKIKNMLDGKNLHDGSDDILKEIMGYDTDCDSVSNSVSNENAAETKESESEIGNGLSNMDIGLDATNADADAGAVAGAGAKFVCDYCGKSFANEANRLKHMNDTCKKVKKNVIENDNA